MDTVCLLQKPAPSHQSLAPSTLVKARLGSYDVKGQPPPSISTGRSLVQTRQSLLIHPPFLTQVVLIKMLILRLLDEVRQTEMGLIQMFRPLQKPNKGLP
ncbi:hypothetical protein ACFPRA_20435 [Sporosarcina soli]|uniref:Uncharacterized protein n=1 Tax=Sporosarcina soli TaxID=334736 RepID=A0ABW0TS58_9BACL